MAITIGNNTYRNLQEQVYENVNQIVETQEDLTQLETNTTAQLATKQNDVIESKGDLVVGDSSGDAAVFSGNNTVNKKYLTETSGTPAWSDIEATELKTTGATFRQAVMATSLGGTYLGWVQGHDIASEQSAGYPLPAESGKVLTADGSNGASWENIYGEDLLSTGATAGQVLMADGNDAATWQSVNGTDIQSIGMTQGTVLTANGSGGATWEDVPQNFTGRTSGVGIVVSVGTNQLAGMTGTDGQFLKWVGAGPAFVTVPNAEDEEV